MADLRRVTLLAAALAIAGCGSGSTASQQTPAKLSAAEQEVADGYLQLVRDFAARRYREFCDALTPESREVTARNFVGVEMTCVEWAEENGEIFREDFVLRAEHAKVLDVEIYGDEALVDWTATNDFGDRVEAKRIGGRWKYTAVTPAS